MNSSYLLIFFSILFCLYIIFKKLNFLVDDTNYSNHKSIGISNKNPIILGGIYITLSLFVAFPDSYNFLKIICVCILILGLLSDRNFLQNPITRLILQIFILFLLIYIENLNIRTISLNFFDNLLSNKIFNILFTLFCFSILINGSNFLDGLNGLLSGYYLFVLGSLFYIVIFDTTIQIENLEFLFIILKILFIFFLLNIFGFIYLGDSGSYIISIIIGYLLVKEHQHILNLSPYYVVSILWYPAFENLFTLIRRLYLKQNISVADRFHLHQLIYRYFKLKKIITEKYINTFTSTIILIFNIPIFVVASLKYEDTLSLVFIIFFNIILYLAVYIYLVKNFFK